MLGKRSTTEFNSQPQEHCFEFIKLLEIKRSSQDLELVTKCKPQEEVPSKAITAPSPLDLLTSEVLKKQNKIRGSIIEDFVLRKRCSELRVMRASGTAKLKGDFCLFVLSFYIDHSG